MPMSVYICYWLNRLCCRVLGERFGAGDPCIWNYIDGQYSWGSKTMEIFGDYITLQGKKVLDGGCGPGGRSMFYADNGACEVLGVDVFEGDLPFAREAATKRGLENISFVRASLSAIPTADSEFDLIFLNDVFEHIDRQLLGQVLAELKRVLKPDGRLCIEFPPWTGAYGGHLLTYIKMPWAHLLFSDDTIRQVLYKCDPRGKVTPEHCIKEYHTLNRIEPAQFRRLIADSGFKVIMYKEPALKKLNFLKYIPFIGKNMISRVEVVLTKDHISVSKQQVVA